MPTHFAPTTGELCGEITKKSKDEAYSLSTIHDRIHPQPYTLISIYFYRSYHYSFIHSFIHASFLSALPGRIFGTIDADSIYGKAKSVIYRRGDGLVWRPL